MQTHWKLCPAAAGRLEGQYVFKLSTLSVCAHACKRACALVSALVFGYIMSSPDIYSKTIRHLVHNTSMVGDRTQSWTVAMLDFKITEVESIIGHFHTMNFRSFSPALFDLSTSNFLHDTSLARERRQVTFRQQSWISRSLRSKRALSCQMFSGLCHVITNVGTI